MGKAKIYEIMHNEIRCHCDLCSKDWAYSSVDVQRYNEEVKRLRSIGTKMFISGITAKNNISSAIHTQTLANTVVGANQLMNGAARFNQCPYCGSRQFERAVVPYLGDQFGNYLREYTQYDADRDAQIRQENIRDAIKTKCQVLLVLGWLFTPLVYLIAYLIFLATLDNKGITQQDTKSYKKLIIVNTIAWCIIFLPMILLSFILQYLGYL